MCMHGYVHVAGHLIKWYEQIFVQDPLDFHSYFAYLVNLLTKAAYSLLMQASIIIYGFNLIIANCTKTTIVLSTSHQIRICL